MIAKFRSAPLLLCAALFASWTPWASPVQRTQIPADPSWVLHLDLDQFKVSKVGQFILAELGKPEALAKLAAFQAIFNFDPRENLNSLTLYGTSPAPEDAVLLVRGEFDLDRLVTLAKGAKDYQETPHGQYVIRSWIDERKAGSRSGQHRTYAAAHKDGAVVFAQKPDRVASALDVLDRTQPSLQGTQLFPALGAEADPAVIVGVARELAIPQNAPNAAMLKQAKTFALRVVEKRGEFGLELRVQTASEEVAKQLQSIGQGLVALLALQPDKPEAARIAQALSFAQDGDHVTAWVRMPAEELVRLLQEKAAQKAASKP